MNKGIICHKCREPNCWNPDHIYIGDTSSNTLDAIADGTFKNGNSDKTHCKHGHELSPGNTYKHKDRNGLWHRRCRICRSRLSEEYRNRKKKHRD